MKFIKAYKDGSPVLLPVVRIVRMYIHQNGQYYQNNEQYTVYSLRVAALDELDNGCEYVILDNSSFEEATIELENHLQMLNIDSYMNRWSPVIGSEKESK